jgi:transglutaminase-like putative cysteine protease
VREELAPRAVGIVSAAYVLAVLLHVDRTPFWSTAIALAIVAWRQLAARQALPFAGTALRVAITLALTALVAVSYRTLNGLTAGGALLVVMGAAKLLELRSRRDALVVIAVALFLLLAACLDRQTLPHIPLYAATAWLACTALAALDAGAGRAPPIGAAARSAGRALLYALPLAAVASLFFPRLGGGLWALPADQRATTGLSDEMSPGSITELTDSDDIVFRVHFLDATPPPQERYWRGPVLHDFDGYTWRRGQPVVRPNTTGVGTVYRQRVTLEPHQRAWWFALDTALAAPSRAVMLTHDNQLLAYRPVTQAVTYEAASQTQLHSSDPLSTLGRRYDTHLPPGRNRRTVALAAQLREGNPETAAYIQAVLALFRDGGFEYTLTPPRLDYDSIDDLLFNTKLGFCGHFASAFTTLMRAGGVPARVVTGYLGGEWNPIGDYFIVRQSDAHAWSEVWVEDRGWTRIDPRECFATSRCCRGCAPCGTLAAPGGATTCSNSTPARSSICCNASASAPPTGVRSPHCSRRVSRCGSPCSRGTCGAPRAPRAEIRSRNYGARSTGASRARASRACRTSPWRCTWNARHAPCRCRAHRCARWRATTHSCATARRRPTGRSAWRACARRRARWRCRAAPPRARRDSTPGSARSCRRICLCMHACPTSCARVPQSSRNGCSRACASCPAAACSCAQRCPWSSPSRPA